MGGSAGEGDDFVAGNQNNREVLQIVCPFALAAETQFFFGDESDRNFGFSYHCA
jgi:hypothetical protein